MTSLLPLAIHEGWPIRIAPPPSTTEILPLPPPAPRKPSGRLIGDAALTEAIDAFRTAMALASTDPRAHHNLGVAYALQGALDSATARFQGALACDSTFAPAFVELGNTLLAMGNHREAIDALQNVQRLPAAARSEVDHPRVSHLLGIAFGRQGAYEDAVRHVEAAIERRPDYAAAHYGLGVALLRREPEASADAFRQTHAADSSFAEARYQLGVALLRQGRATEAAATLRDIVETAPDRGIDPGISYVLALAELRASRETAAIATLDRWRPDFAEAHYLRGLALEALGRYDTVADSYHRAIEGGYRPAYYRLGLMLAASRARTGTASLRSAASYLRTATRWNPSRAEPHYALGAVLADLGGPDELDEAITSLRTAIARRPSWGATYAALGAAQFRRGQWEEALVSLRTARNLDRTDPIAHHNLGVVFARQGDLDSAASSLTAAVELGVERPGVTRYARGWVHLWLGDYGMAVDDFQAALPHYALARYALGHAFYLSDRFDEAIANYRLAAEHYSQAYADLGSALLQIDRVEEAIEVLRRGWAVRGPDPLVFNNLAWALYRQGGDDELVEAAWLSDSSLALLPQDAPERWMYLDTRANIALDRGDAERARDLFEEAIVMSGASTAEGGDVEMLHLGLGMALLELGRQADAVAAYRMAVAVEEQALTDGHWREMGYSTKALKRLRLLRRTWQRS